MGHDVQDTHHQAGTLSRTGASSVRANDGCPELSEGLLNYGVVH